MDELWGRVLDLAGEHKYGRRTRAHRGRKRIGAAQSMLVALGLE